MKVAHALASTYFLQEGKESHSAVKCIDKNSLPQSLKAALQDKIGKTLPETVKTAKCLKVNGIVHNINPHACYILDFIDDIPCFAQVKHIVHLENEWYFCLKLLLPQTYNETAHAYVVEPQSVWIIVLPDSLIDSHKHRIYKKNQITYAYPTYFVTKYLKDSK